DAHPLTVRAVDEAGLTAPDGGPQVPFVPGDGDRNEALLRQKRQGARGDSRRDDDAVAAGDVALAGTLLHRDFSFMKWLIAHGASRSEGENGVAGGRIGGDARVARRFGT